MGALATTWPLRRLLWRLSAREWALHPWRHGVVVLAVALGVALAWSVHLINHSALAEFAAAVRAANGQPDLSLRAISGGFDDAWLARVQAEPEVLVASPVVELDTYARGKAAASRDDAAGSGGMGTRVAVRVIGIDALVIAALAPELMPRATAADDRWSALDTTTLFANASARAQLAVEDGRLALQAGARWQTLRLAGDIAAPGPPLLVMDIAGAQEHFGFAGRLTRIDLRLAAGTDRAALLARLALPPAIVIAEAAAGEQRVSNLSRAYRVNLTVLALVALFVGAFLVFSVVALSVAQRTPGFALLGVLGLTAGERRTLVLLESALLGAVGSLVGVAAGTTLAAAALHWLAGDLGGGYFPGVAPRIQFDAPVALLFFALGIASALAGAWVPARQAEALQPALALKGLGGTLAPRRFGATALPIGLLVAGALMALLPPVGGLPVAAYAAVAALLFGGVALVPALVDMLLRAVPRPRHALPLLALARAHHERHTATAAVAGVVASLALAVALTVMVASFRDGVASWLDEVLPADLYARSASRPVLADQAWFDDATLARIRALPGVARVQATRVQPLQLDAAQPAVALLARALDDDAARSLPLVAPALPASLVQPGEVGVYVSEAMVTRYGAAAGTLLTLPLRGQRVQGRVLGVWRDYARQFGTVAMPLERYRALTGDHRLNDLALWLAPGAAVPAVQAGVREAMAEPSMIEFATSTELRRLSLAIFDRSFAVTRWLQGVAVLIGLVGIATSFSAQVLARRKEFGLLAHLGLTRRQVLALVAGEALAWIAAGVAAGLALGAAVSVVLVRVVNPQSFHWTMELVWPWPQLLGLALLVLGAGVLTAWGSAGGATQRSAVMAVKEDW